jgi:hypothetical protein
MFKFDVLSGGAPKLNRDPRRIAEIEAWVLATLPEDGKSATLMVQEVACNGKRKKSQIPSVSVCDLQHALYHS